MANSDKDIKITPNTNQAGFPVIEFVGSSSAPITLSVLDDNSLSFSGSEGQLFSINNNLTSGTIFSVNDVSGIPSIEVDADGTVSLAEFGGNVGIGTSSPTHKLEVVGHLSASVISASTYVGAGDVTSTGNNTFSGINTFNTNFITASAGITGSVAYLGQIGIGKTDPSYLLDVYGTNAAPAGDKSARFGDGIVAGKTYIGRWANSSNYSGLYHSDFTGSNSVSNYMLIQSSGGDTFLNAASSSSGIGSMYFRIFNTDRMFISSSGDVGVGTSTPSYKLDVNGTLRASSIIVDTNLIKTDTVNDLVDIGDVTTANGNPATLRVKCGTTRNDGLQLYRYDNVGNQWYIWQDLGNNLLFEHYQTTGTKAIHFTQNADMHISGNIIGSLTSTSTVAARKIVTNFSASSTATWYIPFVDDFGGGNLEVVTDGGLSYIPNTNALTASYFVGALKGNADTATSATSVAIGTANYTITTSNTQYIDTSVAQLNTVVIDSGNANTSFFIAVTNLTDGKTNYVNVRNDKASTVTLLFYAGVSTSISPVNFSNNGGTSITSKTISASGGNIVLWYANVNGTLIGGTY